MQHVKHPKGPHTTENGNLFLLGSTIAVTRLVSSSSSETEIRVDDIFCHANVLALYVR